MRIDLSGQMLLVLGDANPVALAVSAALASDGARMLAQPEEAPDILLLSAPLRADTPFDPESLMAEGRRLGAVMADRGRGRIVVLLSALGAMPMRRHPDLSMRSAALVAGTRALAMQLGPQVLVNAIGIGLVGDPPMSGDVAMQDHAALGRPGRIEEVVGMGRLLCNPRCTYVSGQLLLVDGGWSVGYGRNF